MTGRGEIEPRIVLGAAQLGMHYGIANETGRPDDDEVLDIVRTALENGVSYFDTAQVYGESETVLGWAFRTLSCSKQVRVISKFSPHLSPEDLPALRTSLIETRERLGIDSLYCMMMHRVEWLSYLNKGLGSVFRKEQEAGRIQHVGVSVYDPEEALAALAHPEIEAIQAPCNAWDQGLVKQGVLAVAKELGKLVFVRSIYLQGLLVLSADKVKKKLPRAYEAAKKWEDLARNIGQRPAEVAVRFALSLDCPVVVGVETVAQLRENLKLFCLPPLSDRECREIETAMGPFLGNEIANPTLWSTGRI